MLVGVPKEIKNHEYRVGLTPESVHELTAHGHEVLVETGAGEGIGAHDALYERAGATIIATAAPTSIVGTSLPSGTRTASTLMAVVPTKAPKW